MKNNDRVINVKIRKSMALIVLLLGMPLGFVFWWAAYRYLDVPVQSNVHLVGSLFSIVSGLVSHTFSTLFPDGEGDFISGFGIFSLLLLFLSVLSMMGMSAHYILKWNS